MTTEEREALIERAMARLQRLKEREALQPVEPRPERASVVKNGRES